MDFKQGHHLNLSSMSSTLHLGAHADAPSHYHPQGKTIEHCDLDIYLGPCEVVDVSGIKGEISLKNLPSQEFRGGRVLFKTQSMASVDEWSNTFSYLAEEVVEALSKQGVRLIGIDTPSMDHPESKMLPAHHSFFRHQIHILEGLVLDSVPEGRYFLIALPLKIEGAEASPVRAILLDQWPVSGAER